MVAPSRRAGTPTPGRAPSTASRRVKLGLIAFTAIVVTAGLLAGAATGTFAWLGRTALYGAGVYRDGGSGTVPPGFFDTPAPSASATPSPTASASGRVPAPVLAEASAGRDPRSDRLGAKIAALEAKGIGRPGFAVGDPTSGDLIITGRGTTAMIPASSLKLLTSLAALDAYGPEHRFSTTLVSAQPGVVVLVGGGDPYLGSKRNRALYPARASLDDLADRTVASLKAAGRARTAVRLDYDTTLFPGASWNPAWPVGYRDQTTPTSALWSDEGRLASGSPGPRSTDPAGDAARRFAAALKARGVPVALGRSTTAPDGATTLGTVRSMPLGQIVEEVLLHSDNDAAEVLFRQVAVADGRPGTIAQAAAAMERRLTRLGLWTPRTVIQDGSGLSRGNRVEPQTFLGLLELAMATDRPTLRPLLTGLPVAGTDGSLRGRFFAAGTTPGRGDVHAKTGTLRGVHSLVGYATTASGATVAFAFMVNDATSDYNARTWLDRAAATVAACGC